MMTPEEMQQKMDTLDNWELEGTKRIHKSFTFKNFKQALDFTNKVGAEAEDMQHHPDIYLTWGKVKIDIYTHRTDHLTESDFQLAERIDQITSTTH